MQLKFYMWFFLVIFNCWENILTFVWMRRRFGGGMRHIHTSIHNAQVCVCVSETDRLTWPHDQRSVGLFTCRCVLNWMIAASNRIEINFQFELVSTSLFSNILLIRLRHARCERQWRTLAPSLFFTSSKASKSSNDSWFPNQLSFTIKYQTHTRALKFPYVCVCGGATHLLLSPKLEKIENFLFLPTVQFLTHTHTCFGLCVCVPHWLT